MYNLSEEKHIFLHVTYSMLEEGYDIDEILGMWILADKEKVSELMESLTLTEDIDLGNQDLADITSYYFNEGSSAAAANAPKVWSWLTRLFGRGGKIRPPRPPRSTNPRVTTNNTNAGSTTTSGGRPITSSGQRNTTSAADKVTRSGGANTLADKVKQQLPKILVPGAVVGGGLLVGGSNVTPPIPTETEKDKTPPEPEKGPVITDPAGNPVQFPPLTPPPPVPKDEKSSSSSTSGRNRRYGGWRLQNLEKDLYKRSPGYQVSLKAYRNIRANPIPSIYKDHYEVIADYLINEGHASDIEEANYVMQQLDEDFIQSIIESSCGGSHKKKKKKK